MCKQKDQIHEASEGKKIDGDRTSDKNNISSFMVFILHGCDVFNVEKTDGKNWKLLQNFDHTTSSLPFPRSVVFCHLSEKWL